MGRTRHRGLLFQFEDYGQVTLCRPSLIWEYNETIRAAQKEFIWFDNAAISRSLTRGSNLLMNCHTVFCPSPPRRNGD